MHEGSLALFCFVLFLLHAQHDSHPLFLVYLVRVIKVFWGKRKPHECDFVNLLSILPNCFFFVDRFSGCEFVMQWTCEKR